MELNDTKLNFYFKQYSIVRTSESFLKKHILYFQVSFFFLTETFVLYLCNFNVAGIAF